MARDINLNSSEWCDLVFEGKNKDYGAYEMRQTSSSRHLIAFLCTLVFITIVALIPSFMSAISKNKDVALSGYDGPLVVTDVDLTEEVPQEVIEQSIAPPPPPIINSVQFTPPAIVDDAEVNAENEMRTQEELSNSTALITTVTYHSENTEGADPGELLQEQRDVIGTAYVPDKPFETAEVMPQYPGGNSELMRFMKNNLKYPTIAAETGIEGRVVVKFVVDKNGAISDIQVLKGIDPSCDKEAVRVVKLMPNWIPGMQNGNPVSVYFNLPVFFKLEK